MRESGLSYCITHREPANELAPAKVIVLDELDLGGMGSTGGNSPLECHTRPSQPACVLYSKAAPNLTNAVLVTHQNLVQATCARAIVYPEAVRRCLVPSSGEWQHWIKGIFWTLVQGGTIVLPGADEGASPSSLIEAIAHNHVSHLLLQPSLYEQLLADGSAGQLTALQAVVLSGEGCSPELIAQHARTLPAVEIAFEYGPLEATLWSAVNKWKGLAEQTPMSIGRPIPNAHIYILDPKGHPTPIWVPGEIFVGGDGIVAGYFGAKECDHVKSGFTPDLLGQNSSGCLFATGDWGRWRADGTVELLPNAPRAATCAPDTQEPDAQRHSVEHSASALFALNDSEQGNRVLSFGVGVPAGKAVHSMNPPLSCWQLTNMPNTEENVSSLSIGAAPQPADLSPVISPANSDRAPVSHAQQRLWFLEQLEPGTPLYNVPFVVRLRGELKTGALQDALNEVIARHEALRTNFLSEGGAPVQVIHRTRPIQISQIDLPAEVDTGKFQAVLASEARRPFRLEEGPLLRACLFTVGEKEHVLLICLHHIICDEWSIGVLARELETFYSGYAAGQVPILPELPIQYADYAIWQREWLQGPVLAKQLHYWTDRLRAEPPRLELPAGGRRADRRLHEGRRFFVDLSPAFREPAGIESALRGHLVRHAPGGV